VVVIPVGGQSKEHGPHLPLGPDFIQAEYFKNRVLFESDVLSLSGTHAATEITFTGMSGTTV
jgi:creatinine amidohydrolase